MKHIRTLTISLLLLFLFGCQPGDPAETDSSPTINPSPTAGDSALGTAIEPNCSCATVPLKKLSSVGVGITLAGKLPFSVSWANLWVCMLANCCCPILVPPDRSHDAACGS